MKDRFSDHEFSIFDTGNGLYRILISSKGINVFSSIFPSRSSAYMMMNFLKGKLRKHKTKYYIKEGIFHYDEKELNRYMNHCWENK